MNDNNDSPPTEVAAVDFETTYDKACSIKPLGWDAYFRHPHFEAYLVAIKTSDGIEFVGHPKDAPWAKIAGHHWISHNAAFDENLYLIAKELGWWGDIPVPPFWDCTMDLVAYLGYPHSLKNAVKKVFNVELSKEARNSAAGKRPPRSWPSVHNVPEDVWTPMTDEEWDDMLAYALSDSEWCLKLWDVCAERWPEKERWLSRHTRTIARRGIPCDIALAQQSARDLKAVLHEFESAIPWADSDALLSRPAFDRQAKKEGLTPPKSLAQDNAEGDAWLSEHQDDYPWIYAYRNWRKANSLLKKVEAVVRGTRKVGDHYRFFGQMKYCGAHTKRWSGGGGNLNLQNPLKGEQYFACNGVESRFRFRDFFAAPPGYKMAAIDLSQIEVRTLAWLSRDKEMLTRIADSPDIYQAFAEKFGLWDPARGVMKQVDPDLRNFVKPVVLGSGFGASAFAFAEKEARELKRALARKYDGVAEEVKRRDAMAWLDEMREVGCWWWKKAGRMLTRDATVEVERTTAAGKQFTSTEPQWKAFAKHIDALDKKLERYAEVPVDLDAWDWDTELVLIMKEATYCVNLYRSSMTKVTGFWKRLKETAKRSVMDRHMSFRFPSGNSMNYSNVRTVKVETKGDEDDENGKDQKGKKKKTETQILCNIVRNGQIRSMKPWYGLLAENLAQSLARDVFAECLIALEEAGFEILFHVHDEIVVLIPADSAPEQIAEAERLMSVSPDWIPDLPVASEGNAGRTYADCK